MKRITDLFLALVDRFLQEGEALAMAGTIIALLWIAALLIGPEIAYDIAREMAR